MVIRTNITALRTLGESRKQFNAMQETLEKLSSGYNINRAADDAAGLGISEEMRAQIAELARCQQNVGEGVDVTKTADGALAEINDMLRRARELCIEAANGIYDHEDLASISAEMNALFDEIDRITAGTTHNEIQLFRFKGASMDTKYEYIETYTPTVDGLLEDWGEMDEVADADFDLSKPGKAATVEFQLEDGIDVNDASTLAGKSITIGDSYGREYTFNFTDGQYTFPSGYPVSVSSGMTVQAAMNSLVNAYNAYTSYPYERLTSATVDASGKVKLTASLTTLNNSVNADGMNSNQTVSNGNGSYANGVKVISKEGSVLKQVDGSFQNNNKPVYDDAATATIAVPGGNPAAFLTQNQVDNLKQNSVTIAGKTVKLADLGPTTAMTWEDFAKALATKLTGGNLTATYADGKISLTQTGLGTGNKSVTYYETTKSGTSPTYKTEYSPDKLQGSGLGLTVDHTKVAGNESIDEYKITIPSSPSVPFSFSVNGQNYVFYDGSQTYPPAGYTDTAGGTAVKVPTGTTGAALTQLIANTISGRTGGSASIEGNVLTLRSGGYNQRLTVNIGTSPVELSFYRRVVDTPGTPGSSAILNIGNATWPSYFQREVSVPLQIPMTGADVDLDALSGSGFRVNGKRFEFTNGTASIQDAYGDIDISGITDVDDLADAIQAYLGNGYTVAEEPAGSGTLNIKFKVTANNTTLDVVDGYHDTDGIITNPGDADVVVEFAGGTNTDKPNKEIDFSFVNTDNLDSLLGKGFRVTCATCKGEYINVIFCYNNNGQIPESFEVPDPDNPSVIRTIHNVAVELSQVSSGDTIVQDIVNQLRPKLNHFTDVAVGDPPTKLVFMDKRAGNVEEPAGSGNVVRAKVITGLHTNFTYTVEKKEIVDSTPLGDGSGLAVEFRKMYIYAGSHPTHQFIPIHLPYLDLPTLNLRPPEVSLESGDDPFDWLDRVDAANNAITTARGRIGADCNRLEHTGTALADAHEHITESESRIRDADMAKLMAQQVKLSILGQAQESMLAQANMQPQAVLELLK